MIDSWLSIVCVLRVIVSLVSSSTMEEKRERIKTRRLLNVPTGWPVRNTQTILLSVLLRMLYVHRNDYISAEIIVSDSKRTTQHRVYESRNRILAFHKKFCFVREFPLQRLSLPVISTSDPIDAHYRSFRRLGCSNSLGSRFPDIRLRKWKPRITFPRSSRFSRGLSFLPSALSDFLRRRNVIIDPFRKNHTRSFDQIGQHDLCKVTSKLDNVSWTIK